MRPISETRRTALLVDMHHGAIIIETRGKGLLPRSVTLECWTDRKDHRHDGFQACVDDVVTRFADADQGACAGG